MTGATKKRSLAMSLDQKMDILFFGLVFFLSKKKVFSNQSFSKHDLINSVACPGVENFVNV